MGRNWVLIVGARPQFIKASALCKAISEHNLCSVNKINLDILHTGQHYDNEMSQIFFNELEIPSPKWNLHCDSSDVNLMSNKIIDTLKGENIDKIIVFGDTNSTLSGAISAETLNTNRIQRKLFPVQYTASLLCQDIRMCETTFYRFLYRFVKCAVE